MSSNLLIPPVLAQQSYKEVKFTETVKGRKTNFCVLDSVDTIPSLDKVTSVAVVPFMYPDKIVATILTRGLDIPGGHLEKSDNGIVGAAKREAYEEARIFLANPLYLIGVISSDYKGKNIEQTTYMLITTARVKGSDDFVAEFESIGREAMATEAFLAGYSAGSNEMMHELMKRAEGLSGMLFA